MNMRKVTSLTSLLSFILVLATSVILYFEPHGRVAYWADWHFWGLSKDDWGAIHICTGFLFLAASLIHIYLNWNPIVSYLKNKARRLTFSTPAFVVSLVLTLFVTAGSVAGWPPMKQILDFGEYLKGSWVSEYGTPPYGHAELSSLAVFCKRLGLDSDKALAALQAKGLDVASKQETILAIGKAANLTPKQVYDVILSAVPSGDSFSALPSTPPEGMGKMTISQVCDSFGLPHDRAMAKLEAAGFKASLSTTLKRAAAENGVRPSAIYQALRK